MRQSTTGECFVCGKETTRRCTNCAESSLNVFFCSLEHQELVWTSHARVCKDSWYPLQTPLLVREVLEAHQCGLMLMDTRESAVLDQLNMMGPDEAVYLVPNPHDHEGMCKMAASMRMRISNCRLFRTSGEVSHLNPLNPVDVLIFATRFATLLSRSCGTSTVALQVELQQRLAVLFGLAHAQLDPAGQDPFKLKTLVAYTRICLKLLINCLRTARMSLKPLVGAPLSELHILVAHISPYLTVKDVAAVSIIAKGADPEMLEEIVFDAE
ncbi:hypothetical protein JCM8097_002681 [Rhodosporidiobolus ruineniae]